MLMTNSGNYPGNPSTTRAGQYRKKSLVVEAEQFWPEVEPWPTGVVKDDKSPTGYSIGTLENVAQGHEVTPGDWIITGTAGEKYPCKDHIFINLYDKVQVCLKTPSL